MYGNLSNVYDAMDVSFAYKIYIVYGGVCSIVYQNLFFFWVYFCSQTLRLHKLAGKIRYMSILSLM